MFPEPRPAPGPQHVPAQSVAVGQVTGQLAASRPPTRVPSTGQIQEEERPRRGRQSRSPPPAHRRAQSRSSQLTRVMSSSSSSGANGLAGSGTRQADTFLVPRLLGVQLRIKGTPQSPREAAAAALGASNRACRSACGCAKKPEAAGGADGRPSNSRRSGHVGWPRRRPRRRGRKREKMGFRRVHGLYQHRQPLW